MKINLKAKKRLFDGFFKIDQYTIEHELYTGATQTINRLNFERGDAVAIVVYNTDNNTYLFTEQLRVPVWTKEPRKAYFTELVAGMVEEGNSHVQTAMSELKEELGFNKPLWEFIKLDTFYLSPGGSNERIFLYYVEVCNVDRTDEGGGIKTEGEDIRLLEIPEDQVKYMVNNHLFFDAKTIIGLNMVFGIKRENKS